MHDGAWAYVQCTGLLYDEVLFVKILAPWHFRGWLTRNRRRVPWDQAGIDTDTASVMLVCTELSFCLHITEYTDYLYIILRLGFRTFYVVSKWYLKSDEGIRRIVLLSSSALSVCWCNLRSISYFSIFSASQTPCSQAEAPALLPSQYLLQTARLLNLEWCTQMSSVVEIQSFYEFLVVKHDTLSIEVRRTIYHLLFAFSHDNTWGLFRSWLSLDKKRWLRHVDLTVIRTHGSCARHRSLWAFGQPNR